MLRVAVVDPFLPDIDKLKIPSTWTVDDLPVIS